MLSIGHPKLNMQFESPGSSDRLVQAVQKAMPEGEVEDAPDKSAQSEDTESNNQQAFQVRAQ